MFDKAILIWTSSNISATAGRRDGIPRCHRLHQKPPENPFEITSYRPPHGSEVTPVALAKVRNAVNPPFISLTDGLTVLYRFVLGSLFDSSTSTVPLVADRFLLQGPGGQNLLLTTPACCR